MFARDIALVGRNQPFAARQLRDRGDGGVAIDGRAQLARALGQRLGQIGRLNISVRRMLDRAKHAGDVGQRPDLFQLFGRQPIDLDADRLGDTGVRAVFIEAILAGRDADVRHVRKPDVQPGFGFEARVQRDRILVQLAHRIAEVEQRQQAGGVPGRARRQFLALDQRDIGPAELCQMVQRADANHAATDHNHTCCRLHHHTFAALLSEIKTRLFTHHMPPRGKARQDMFWHRKY